MQKHLRVVALGIILLVLVGFASAGQPVPTDPGDPTTTVGITGVIAGPFYGTPERDLRSCESLGYISVTVNGEPTKIDPVESGTYLFDGGKELTLTVDGNLVDFTSNFDVGVVVVKGGPYADIFTYPAGIRADTGLHAPVNPENGEYYGISHVNICNPSDTNVPEFPTLAIPAGLLVGFIGLVSTLRSRKE